MSFYSSNGKYSSGRSRRRRANPRQTAPGQNPRGRHTGRVIFNVVLAILILAALGFGGYAVMNVVKLSREQARLEEMAQQVHSETTAPRQTEPAETTLPDETTAPETVEPPKVILPEYAHLHEQNPDLVGWVMVEGTRIDYPVMYSPQDPEKYLHADFTGAYSFSGTPFLEGSSTVDSDQLLVYGHNMKNGTMFADLMKYQNQDFFEEHPVIRFSTLYDHYDYAIMAVLYERVYYKNEDVFKFYQFIDAADQTEFDEAVDYYKEHSAYETGITAEYGDQLLALVTCAYHTEDGRFVVIARRTAE